MRDSSIGLIDLDIQKLNKGRSSSGDCGLPRARMRKAVWTENFPSRKTTFIFRVRIGPTMHGLGAVGMAYAFATRGRVKSRILWKEVSKYQAVEIIPLDNSWKVRRLCVISSQVKTGGNWGTRRVRVRLICGRRFIVRFWEC